MTLFRNRTAVLTFAAVSVGVVVALAALAFTAATDDDAASEAHGAHGVAAAAPEKQSTDAFRADMRKLWEDHVTWTRLFIVSFAADLPDLQATTDRLLANQTDIGDAVKPYYGEAAGDQLTELLREHILQAADLLAAAASGDTTDFEAARAAWYANADEIAAFLNEANPRNWPLTETQHHMRMHLDLTLEEAANRLAGDYAADIAAYDAVHLAILEMSDFLSEGIIKQFPQHFRGN